MTLDKLFFATLFLFHTSDIIVTGEQYRTSDELVTELTMQFRRTNAEEDTGEPPTER